MSHLYLMMDQTTGQIVAAVPAADPDVQRVLAKYRFPTAPTPVAAPAPQATIAWTPAAAARPEKYARAPKDNTVYKIRHVPSGRFLAMGLDPNSHKLPKTWVSHGDARNAVAAAVRHGRGARSEFEIVAVPLDGN